MLVRIWRTGNPCALLAGMWIIKSTMENSMEDSWEVKNKTPIRSTKCHFWIYIQTKQNHFSKRYLRSLVNYSIIHNSHGVETTQVSVDVWMEKKIYTHTTAYYSVLKKEILSFVTTWIELEDIVLGEISQIEKSKYCLISFICGI